ncbi:hypothetical protein MNBD_BACTEROID01-1821 [hydrothermal vent metagenome]|uniref:Uncharacterized protein n=1 Tax=hydrothermal vent metagenome TaxID=652676 RepID=A0A3B0TU89_9ZZZZ
MKLGRHFLRMRGKLSITLLAGLVIVVITVGLAAIHFRSFNKSRYQAVIIKEELFDGQFKFYSDLDNNGDSEFIVVGDKNDTCTFLEFFTQSSASFAKVTIMGRLICSNPSDNIIFEDFDNNGQKEVYLITYWDNSVFMDVYEPCTKRYILKHYFIDSLNTPKSESDIKYKINGMADIDGDNFKELYCTITAGLSLQPRNIYMVDINDSTVKKSPLSYATPFSFKIYNAGNNGGKEILAGTYSTDNSPEDYPFSDHFSWLFVFDSQLNFQKKPIKFPRNVEYTKTIVISNGSEDFVLVLNEMRSPSLLRSKLQVLDSGLKVIKERVLPKTLHNYKHDIYPLPDKKQFLLMLSCGEKWILDYNLDLQQKIKKLGDLPLILKGNVTIDGSVLYIFNQPNSDNFFFTDESFSKVSRINIPFISLATSNISLQKRKGQTPLIFMQQGTDTFWVEYKKNRLFYLQLTLFYGVLLIVVVIVWGSIKMLYIRRIKEVLTEKQLIYFQFQSLKNQLTPHFIYNTLNAIGNLILLKQNNKAYKLLISFSKLQRALIENPESNARTLEEEVDFVKQYLAIQDIRFGGRFKTYLEIDPDVDLGTPVPKLILQTYVDNAIKHGLWNTDSGGEIIITIKNKVKNRLILRIKDNGIGRAAAAKYKNGTGKGMDIMEKYYLMFKEHFGYAINTLIIDLTDEQGKACGTEAVISIEKVKAHGKPVRKRKGKG